MNLTVLIPSQENPSLPRSPLRAIARRSSAAPAAAPRRHGTSLSMWPYPTDFPCRPLRHSAATWRRGPSSPTPATNSGELSLNPVILLFRKISNFGNSYLPNRMSDFDKWDIPRFVGTCGFLWNYKISLLSKLKFSFDLNGKLNIFLPYLLIYNSYQKAYYIKFDRRNHTYLLGPIP